ncbi:MAG: phosphoribosylformylglycinamidine synthase subunit PurQ [Phycisphaerales bacterium]|nr:phosphoribosylformylglycinamidine synthase subunit PurQ [Phycisphaerales bacterium]
MPTVNVLILRAAGTNCDLETEHAWRLAGAAPERIHLRRVIENPALIDRYQIVTLPGGFSYGDDISAGRIFAQQLRRHLNDSLRTAVDRGRLILGICNGFQILVKAGLLPDPAAQTGNQWPCTVTYNDPPGFQNRWVTLQAQPGPCVFLEPGRTYEMPIAHGEGRVVFASDADRQRIREQRQAALTYVPSAPGLHGRDPANPNGSADDLAGLCDPTGRVFGLMPHPDRFVEWTQHPCWTSLPAREHGDGLHVFQRAVAYFG